LYLSCLFLTSTSKSARSLSIFLSVRTFSLVKKNSRSGLEFQVFNQEDNDYISLTCPSIRKTQKKIIKTLRIDYQTFINSAFILQGRIDEFSRKSARERKEILSEILGLSRYDELANLAKSHLREINNIIMTKESRLEYIYQEMANLDFYKEKIKELSESYKDISQKIKIEKIRIELKELPSLKEKLVQEEQVLNSDQTLKDKILEERGGYQSKFDQCLKLGKEKKEIGKELEKSKKEQNIY
ncbi:unnamed protein product, partial [marine sediment metagenome]